jgi:hypothetical protein
MQLFHNQKVNFHMLVLLAGELGDFRAQIFFYNAP